MPLKFAGLTCLLLMTLFAAAARSAEVTIRFAVTVPPGTPEDAQVFLSGNLLELGAWQAAGKPLARADDGRYTLDVAVPKDSRLEYKFTLGAWESVEKTATGGDVPNRTAVADRDQMIAVTVASWADGAAAPPKEKKHTLTGNIRSLDDFESKILDNRRPVWVYLPPGYDKSEGRRYPVLYMHDGQNCFDDATSFAGEWKADETAEALISAGKVEPIIIVAVANAGTQRMNEYTPMIDLRLGEGGNGDKYARFLMTELKPFIDKTYRTMPDRDHTAVCGSSLGGLISIHIARTYPDLVGLCGAVSPSLWWANNTTVVTTEHDPAWTANCRIWLDMGTAEGARLGTAEDLNIKAARDFAAALQHAGRSVDHDYKYLEVEGAGHNEPAWADRFDDILLFLFPKNPND